MTACNCSLPAMHGPNACIGCPSNTIMNAGYYVHIERPFDSPQSIIYATGPEPIDYDKLARKVAEILTEKGKNEKPEDPEPEMRRLLKQKAGELEWMATVQWDQDGRINARQILDALDSVEKQDPGKH